MIDCFVCLVYFYSGGFGFGKKNKEIFTRNYSLKRKNEEKKERKTANFFFTNNSNRTEPKQTNKNLKAEHNSRKSKE